MATTGLGQTELMRLRPEDVDLQARLLVARARRKGKGNEGRTIPLTRHAVRALRLYVRLHAFGAFSTSNLRRDFRLAAAAAGYVLRDRQHPDGLDWKPYDARHTFGTEVGLAARDERAVQQLLGHSDIRTTRRYTTRSVDPRVAAAISALDTPTAKRRSP
jgi:integrase/recombinase XerC